MFPFPPQHWPFPQENGVPPTGNTMSVKNADGSTPNPALQGKATGPQKTTPGGSSCSEIFPDHSVTSPAIRTAGPGGEAGQGTGVTHRRRWPATEQCAVSCPWYRASEAHCMMARCIRYCTVSVRTSPAPCSWARRSIRLSDSPARAALHRRQRRSWEGGPESRVQLETRGQRGSGRHLRP